MSPPVSALVARHQGDGPRVALERLDPSELGDGELTIRVLWSSVNYKDALAASPSGRVGRISPLIPGIDLAGEVVDSHDPAFAEGDEVLVHGQDLGVAHHGGYAELARVPAAWALPLPRGLTARHAMALGTAGFTAALSVDQLEARGMGPQHGPVLVLGASGGVGSIAVALLARRGYEVHAATGKPEAAEWLRELGAATILTRDETSADSGKPLERERWAGCVDPVGGTSLAYALRTLRYGAAVASSGLTGGGELNTTVFPFILRGVALLGIDSVQAPVALRSRIWAELAASLPPDALPDDTVREVTLEEVDRVLGEVLAGRGKGRTVVRVEAKSQEGESA